MNEKPYRLIVTQLKELHGGIVVDQKITEEQFIWIVDYIRKTAPTQPVNEPKK
jgi:hypothetical protein